MDSQETSHSSWLHRFSTAEIAIIVFIVSVMAAMTWYKMIYESKLAAIPSKSAASQVSPESSPTPTPDLTAQISDTSGNPAENLPESNPFQKTTNPFSDAYKNPFVQ